MLTFLRQCFLFRRRTEPEWPRWKKAVFYLWNLLPYVLLCLGTALISLVLAVGPYDLELADGFWETPVLLTLNILPVIGLGLLLCGLTGRTPWAFALTGAVVLGLSVGDYWKLVFRDDPVMLGDLLSLREAGNMLGRYHLYWDKTMIATVGFFVLGLAGLWLLCRWRPKWRLRLGLSLGGLALLIGLTPALLSQSLYDGDGANYDYIPSRWSSTQQYMAHGFVYPFLHSVTDTVELPPKGYSQREAQAVLERFRDQDIPADKRVNFIGIQLEAYADFSKFGVPEFNQDIYGVWHDLAAEGVSGNLITNIFAGGTVDTERCFLTGYSALHSYRSPVNSYPWYFRSQGYTVEGMHPSPQWFYNRININENLGFQEYWYSENHFEALSHWTTARDDILFPELLRRYEEMTASGDPYFNFSVTYQGHGPYRGDIFEWEGAPEDYVKPDGYTAEELNMLGNYFAGLYNTGQNLKMLTDALREDEDPVILVIFGDHMPWMGDGNSLYERLGVDLDQSTEEGFRNYYSTTYIIWANEAAKRTLGNDFTGQGPDLSPCFLMNEIFSLCGWEGPAFNQVIGKTAAQVPVIHTTGRYLYEGTLTDSLPPQAEQAVQDYRNAEYDWRKHFAYTPLNNGKDG